MDQIIDKVSEDEIKYSPKGYRIYKVYDDDGNLITNEETLEAIAEAEEIAQEWKRRMERRNRD